MWSRLNVRSTINIARQTMNGNVVISVVTQKIHSIRYQIRVRSGAQRVYGEIVSNFCLQKHFRFSYSLNWIYFTYTMLALSFYISHIRPTHAHAGRHNIFIKLVKICAVETFFNRSILNLIQNISLNLGWPHIFISRVYYEFPCIHRT